MALVKEAVMFQGAQFFSPELSPSAFRDKQIRSKVQGMGTESSAINERPSAKRRKISASEPTSVPFILARLGKVLSVSANEALSNIESGVL